MHQEDTEAAIAMRLSELEPYLPSVPPSQPPHAESPPPEVTGDTRPIQPSEEAEALDARPVQPSEVVEAQVARP